MHPLVLHDTAAGTTLQLLLFAWFAGEATLQRRVNKQSPRRTSDWTYYLVAGGVLLGIVLGFALARVDATVLGGGWWLVASGLGVFAAGVALRFWAILVLGRFFTFHVSIQDDHRVVTGGPYRLVRHPGYTGLLIACVGLGLAFDNGLSLAAATLLPLAGILVRIRVEERELVRALGERYSSEMGTKARLIPKVW